MIGAGDEFDVIVFGAGAGGMSAALVAAIEGQSVLVCEATAQVGGTTATSAGTVWIPGNRQSREAGFHDTQKDGLEYLDHLLGDQDRARRRAYVDTGPKAMDYLESNSEVKFAPSGTHPDYVDALGAAISGRAMAPLAFDARLLGSEFQRIRPPIGEFMLLGGMMAGKADIAHLVNRFRSFASFRHTAKLVLRYAVDRLRYPRGTRLVMGNALVARLYFSLRRRGVHVLFEARLGELDIESGRVAGAWIHTPSGKRYVRARKGVVLATGGMSNHPDLVARLLPATLHELPSLVSSASSGDGVAAARRAGAALSGEGIFWQPVSKSPPGGGRSGLFPHLFLDRAKPGLIAVNSLGRRFVNEAASYHHFCEAMIHGHEHTPSIPAWLVCDCAFIRKYGLGIVPPGTTRLDRYVRSGYLVCANAVDELAARIRVDASGLAQSIDANNRHAQTGVDREFGKGSMEVNRFNGDPLHAPNPCLGPISAKPLCAVAVWPAHAAAGRALATDAEGAVLRPDGTAIPGLFACGNDMASIMGTTYPGPGITLGPALVFGYIVGRRLAAAAPAESEESQPGGKIHADIA